jgi:hypothetical protein
MAENSHRNRKAELYLSRPHHVNAYLIGAPESDRLRLARRLTSSSRPTKIAAR